MPRKNASNRCTKKGCDGLYLITYEDHIPIFTCDVCGHTNLTWKKFYNEYMELFRNKENWNNKKHHPSCILGYFRYLYKKAYGEPYIFVSKSPNPYKTKEIRDTNVLLAAFEGDVHRARKYLKWFFTKKINSAKLFSFAYITTPNLIRQYILYSKSQTIISRDSKLPVSFLSWCEDNASEIFDNYTLENINDLGALLSHVNFYGSDDAGIELMVLSQAEKYNLIVNNRLNVGGYLVV